MCSPPIFMVLQFKRIFIYFRDEILYFPHNIDFRGRVYPIAPYLNHMGGDMARYFRKSPCKYESII